LNIEKHKKSINVHIPNPCHEDWNQMTPESQGRHCASCAKIVTDFTKMTDQELILFLQAGTDGVCGRFRNDQLQRPISLPKPQVQWSFPRFIVTTATAIFTAIGSAIATVKAPNMVTTEETEIQHGGIRIDHPESKFIFGVVTDAGIPLENVKITIPGLAMDTVYTDSAGYYSFKMLWVEATQGLKVRFEHPDYYPQEHPLEEVVGALNIEMEAPIEILKTPMIAGKIMLGEVIEVKIVEEERIKPGEEKVYNKNSPQNNNH